MSLNANRCAWSVVDALPSRRGCLGWLRTGLSSAALRALAAGAGPTPRPSRTGRHESDRRAMEGHSVTLAAVMSEDLDDVVEVVDVPRLACHRGPTCRRYEQGDVTVALSARPRPLSRQRHKDANPRRRIATLMGRCTFSTTRPPAARTRGALSTAAPAPTR